MAITARPTTTIEVDTELLEQLRERWPERSDRELFESAARIELGFETMRHVHDRTAAAGISSAEVEAEAARAVEESRRQRSDP